MLTGDGETGAALVAAGVDKISFTGSVATGRRVAVACAERLIPCTLELGGKDPMIVCADADLDAAAGGAVAGGFLNTGQYCCGTERVYVVEEVADLFTEKVVARARALRQADAGEFDVGRDVLAAPARDRRAPRRRGDGARRAGAGRRPAQSRAEGPVLRAHRDDRRRATTWR